MPVSLPPALASFLDILCCPTCAADLHFAGGALRCGAGHAFDVSRSGYAGLLTGARATSGDDADMARARDRFLGTGAYGRIRDAVAHLAAPAAGRRSTVVDVGCGTGYYLAGVLDQSPGSRGLGLDTAVRALRATARVHERAAAAAWDVYRRFPLRDATVDVVLDVFAPRSPSEFHRILRPEGRLVVVRPTGQHLVELRRQVEGMVTIDPAKEERLQRALTPYFEEAHTQPVEYVASLMRSDVLDLLAMTPSARHVDDVDLIAAGALPERVTVSVLATAYRLRGSMP